MATLADAERAYYAGALGITTPALDVMSLADLLTAFYNNPPLGGATPDADAVTKGKLQLAGVLGGTAALPTLSAAKQAEIDAKATTTALNNGLATKFGPYEIWTTAHDYVTGVNVVKAPFPYGGFWLCASTHTAGASFDGWQTGKWVHLSGKGRGTAANQPNPASGPDGYIYKKTDVNGGTDEMVVSGAWVQDSLGLTSSIGSLLAAVVELTANFDIKAIGTTETDVGLSITVPTYSGNWFLCASSVLQLSTATSGAVGDTVESQLKVTDVSNVQLDLVSQFAYTQVVTATAKTVRNKSFVRIPMTAGQSNADYKLRARTTQAVPANWATALVAALAGVWPSTKMWAERAV